MIDWYTKAVLTVIAICLVVLVVRDSQIIPEVWAADERVVKVQIVGISNRGYHQWGWESIPVTGGSGDPIEVSVNNGIAPILVRIN